jgi:hypothetical protein
MPATVLTRKRVGEAQAEMEGVALDASDGGTAENADGRTFFFVENEDGADTGTFTVKAAIEDAETLEFGTVSKDDVVVALAAGEKFLVGPFATRAFNSGTNLVVESGGTAQQEIKVQAVFI